MSVVNKALKVIVFSTIIIMIIHTVYTIARLALLGATN